MTLVPGLDLYFIPLWNYHSIPSLLWGFFFNVHYIFSDAFWASIKWPYDFSPLISIPETSCIDRFVKVDSLRIPAINFTLSFILLYLLLFCWIQFIIFFIPLMLMYETTDYSFRSLAEKGKKERTKAIVTQNEGSTYFEHNSSKYE